MCDGPIISRVAAHSEHQPRELLKSLTYNPIARQTRLKAAMLLASSAVFVMCSGLVKTCKFFRQCSAANRERQFVIYLTVRRAIIVYLADLIGRTARTGLSDFPKPAAF